MLKKIEKLCDRKIIQDICLMSAYLFIGLCFYEILIYFEKDNFFFFIPIILWLFVILGGRALQSNITEKQNIKASLIIFLILCFVENLAIVNCAYLKYRFAIITIVTGTFIVSQLALQNTVNKEDNLVTSNESTDKHLFNLFYLNLSKVHEIAMLIDNKIMKTIEREQVSEETLKTSSSFSIGKKLLSGEASAGKEDNYKKRVYENFDVKTTKSIMLRKLIDVAKVVDDKCEIESGQLVLFENVELKRRNVDDTVMILNLLRDSNLKNQGNDSIEIDFNKIMENLLEDFSIDYEFEKNDEANVKYLIQLPYKSNEYFENGYQHNDLQLGKLSVVGIYRGKVDFSKRTSVSSRFLELLSESSKTNAEEHDGIMKDSSTIKEMKDLPFKLEQNKLSGEMHLIDVIAIIQELNINKKEQDSITDKQQKANNTEKVNG